MRYKEELQKFQLRHKIIEEKYWRKVKQVRVLKAQLKKHGVKPFDRVESIPKILQNRGECEIGLSIERHRIKHRLKVKEICEKAGISDTSYRNIIKGRNEPRKRTLEALFRTEARDL